MEDNISRILKMLEDGKISAEDAQKLISALGTQQATAPPPPRPPAGSSWGGTQSPPPPPRPERAEEETKPEGSTAKSFEFAWSKKSGLPFDLSGLGKQISDTLKKLDP